MHQEQEEKTIQTTAYIPIKLKIEVEHIITDQKHERDGLRSMTQAIIEGLRLIVAREKYRR